MSAAFDAWLPMAGAFATGVLIGVERGWRLRDRESGQRVAGVRTFILLGLCGGVAGWLTAQQAEWVGAAIVTVAGLIILLGYHRQVDGEGRPDATSAIAAIATLALGFVAGFGSPEIGVALAAIVTLVLAFRAETHRWIASLDEADLKAAVRFAVIALAVRPFLPDHNMGPLEAWNPQQLWLVVILVTGFSFLGYIADRKLGAHRGTVLTAIIGGAYSSTAVTQSLAQRLRQKGSGSAECTGIALASAVMYLRVVLLVLVLAPRFFPSFIIIIAPPLIVSWIAGAWLWRDSSVGERTEIPRNPIALLPAIGFLAFVALAALAARWGLEQFGEEGIAVMLFLMGSMDVDVAIVTAGGLPEGAVGPWIASIALAGTILANMSVKLGITRVTGGAGSRPAALALLSSMVTLAASIAFWWVRS
ncbi:MgtC/SapB family protein [Erythrobacter insulae]|uniref:MgtC/SapB family protein n=1 Tax=Erythrobacter insulae TaxID=2584124 RepID=A0A547PBV3_9SPHN|nr:DUF4010 domain-containing protein [Erythrobacter insulae]TRD11620.1 MgtC/SapB family protein [Erythrobacter insulae]